jgi:hypothetical protein
VTNERINELANKAMQSIDAEDDEDYAFYRCAIETAITKAIREESIVLRVERDQLLATVAILMEMRGHLELCATCAQDSKGSCYEYNELAARIDSSILVTHAAERMRAVNAVLDTAQMILDEEWLVGHAIGDVLQAKMLALAALDAKETM